MRDRFSFVMLVGRSVPVCMALFYAVLVMTSMGQREFATEREFYRNMIGGSIAGGIAVLLIFLLRFMWRKKPQTP